MPTLHWSVLNIGQHIFLVVRYPITWFCCHLMMRLSSWYSWNMWMLLMLDDRIAHTFLSSVLLMGRLLFFFSLCPCWIGRCVLLRPYLHKQKTYLPLGLERRLLIVLLIYWFLQQLSLMLWDPKVLQMKNHRQWSNNFIFRYFNLLQRNLLEYPCLISDFLMLD